VVRSVSEVVTLYIRYNLLILGNLHYPVNFLSQKWWISQLMLYFMLLMNEINSRNFELHKDIFSYKNDL
jgi:hypothetical protein